MKLSIIFSAVMALSIISTASSRTINLPENLDFGQIAKMTENELDQLAAGLAAEEIIRTKRSGHGSGSGDVLAQVTKKISSGIGQKISLLGSASAGASSFFGGSKGHEEPSYSYGAPPQTYHAKEFDFWTLKKSILNTLFQAVKAITGGVTILKGQLIKGGGVLASGLGKVIKVKGEAVTNLGRHIVNSAALVPPKKHAAVHAAPVHISAAPVHISAPAPHISYSAPSAPSLPVSSYGPPTAPAPSYSYGPPTSSGHYETSGGYYNVHSTQNSLYSGPSKYNLPLEGHGKYPGTGLQAGVILLQPLENTQFSKNHGGHNNGASVTSALQALKGIFNSPTSPSGHGSLASATGIGPSAVQELPSATAAVPFKEDPRFNPPPPSPSSYASYNTDNYPAFKPLTSSGSSQINSYGAPLSPELQSMADSILGINDGSYSSGPSYESYMQSFPDLNGSHSSKSTILIKDGKGLGPLGLWKVNDNIDKLNDARKKTEKISLLPSFFKRMGLVKNTTEPDTKEITPTATSRSNLGREITHTQVDINKSITYELRGNRIVRLVDGKADV